jgi:hypothetical protein
VRGAYERLADCGWSCQFRLITGVSKRYIGI